MHEPDELHFQDGESAEWTDEQLANTVSEVYFELTDVTFAEITAAARECRHMIPSSSGLLALGAEIRRRTLGLNRGFDTRRPFSTPA